ncbi:MAG: hypothetical protein ACLGXA_07975 [Acidobacteriota bacterium]
MEKTFDTKWTAAVQRHLNSNPRVIEYRENEDGELSVKFDPRIPCPAFLRVEARGLGLRELAPRSEG